MNTNTSSSLEKENDLHEFDSFNTLLIVILLLISITISYHIKKYKLLYIAESGCCIFVGLIIGLIARLVFKSTEEIDFLTFNNELFFFLILPPIIFEAGYNVNKKLLFANFFTLSLYAVAGTIISTFIIGFSVYGVGLLGFFDIDTSSPLESLLFGALISATDPVATLSILGSCADADPVCYSLVFGESILNDAVGIVLFKTFEGFKGQEFSFLKILLKFTGVSIGSVFIGVLLGLSNSYLQKHTKMKLFPEYEISVLLLFAYGSYAISESFKLSGIMTLFFCGMVMSHYSNLSSSSNVTSRIMFKSVSVMAEFYIYLYLGIAIFTGTMKHFNFSFFLLAMLFCFIARAFNIFPLSLVANLFRKKRISFKMQIMIWFAGLRGAIAFALSNNMPDLYTSTTLSIVIFTTVIVGGLTEPMMSYTGITNSNEDEAPSPTSDYSVLESSPGPSNKINNEEDNNYQPLESRLNVMIYRFEQEFMQPLFGQEEQETPSVSTEMANVH